MQWIDTGQPLDNYSKNCSKIWIRCSATQQMTISMLRHPFCAGQVSIERASCAVLLKLRINMQNELRHFTPVCPFGIRIEHSQIRYNVLLVVYREDGIRRRNIGDVRIWRWFLHACVTEPTISTSSRPKRSR